ncbi:hypothetical protein PINS_up006927 [Pythium insidiosum]|nr:hypothetical protein PINS_up006927 [Pythium insidiosum]
MSAGATQSARRHRTVTAQGEAPVLQPQGGGSGSSPADQVVVGIAASAHEDLEDWSEDFLEHTPRHSAQEDRLSALGTSERISDGDARSARGLRSFPRASALLNRTLPGRRSWHRQCSSGDSAHPETEKTEKTRELRIRRSASELPAAAAAFGDALTARASHSSLVEESVKKDMKAAFLSTQDCADTPTPIDEQLTDRRSISAARAFPEDDDVADDEDEDWDVEFGFAEGPDDDREDGKLPTALDSSRRRSDNFNIFLRGFHDMMEGEDLLDDDEDLSRSKRTRNSMEEQLFQRRKSDFHAASMDGSMDGALRSSLTSVSGSTEYMLVDKYRLLDLACSSAYAVRIERYPKPCATYSNLERDSSKFPMFTDHRLEQWLQNVVQAKCDIVRSMLGDDEVTSPDPRQRKNIHFHTLVSLPFSRDFVDKCFLQIAKYRFHGEDNSNRELIRVFFEKLATASIADENWVSNLPPGDYEYIADNVMELLQEAARLYGPVSASGKAPSSSDSSSSSDSGIAFWMRHFQTVLSVCVESFPSYRQIIALIELRYVCHHLVGIGMKNLSYAWQVCNQLPEFPISHPIAGPSAPIIMNEIFQYYGSLISTLQVKPRHPIHVNALEELQHSVSHTPIQYVCWRWLSVTFNQCTAVEAPLQRLQFLI